MSSSDPSLGGTAARCEQHRQELAHFDAWQAFRDLLQDANRANVSFYPIDPRGLVVFDTPLSARRVPGLVEDSARLRTRQTSLRSLAEDTDGLAVVNNSDLTEGLRRITADLTSYYLLGYYSSHTALDGKYHRITVRVKRSGATVRARKGYRSATPDEVTQGAAEAAPAAAPANAAASNALNRLALIRPEQTLFLHTTHHPGGPLWVAGEISASVARTPAWAGGARLSIVAIDGAGNTTGIARREIKPGERDFILSIPLDDARATPAQVQVRAEPAGGTPVGLEVTPLAGEPLLLRRSGAAPPKAAADFRFYRTEVLVYRWPLGAGESMNGARVLDRNANPMPVPTTPVEQPVEGASGDWMTGTVTLAPLTNGDYLLELSKKGSAGPVLMLVPFRILR